MDMGLVRDLILKAPNKARFYIGSDSERFKKQGVWHARYTTVVVMHMGGLGNRVFGHVEDERDYDQVKNRPKMRLMNEIIKTANMYLNLADVLDERIVEIHLDISENKKNGSSCVAQEAIGYIQGMCNIVPMTKPNSWAASFAADRYDTIDREARKVAS
jgi:predicted RNase H-related nuclease YkuK (DUF458 family)